MNHNQFPEFARSVEHSPYLTLTSAEGIEISTYRDQDRAYLLVDEKVEYPDTSPNSALDEMLLQPQPELDRDEQYALLLPDNFVTMAQALNDSIGDNTSERSINYGRQLFAEVGLAFDKVISSDMRVPRNLSYKNIIFSKNHEGPQLLPPIEFVSFLPSDESAARNHIIDNFYQYCLEGAVNTTQRKNIPEVFNGFRQVIER